MTQSDIFSPKVIGGTGFGSTGFPPCRPGVERGFSRGRGPVYCGLKLNQAPGRRSIMYQVKIFKGQESNLGGLEKEVNAWLAETNARVIQVFGNMAPLSGERNEGNSLSAYPYVASDVLFVVLYETR
jgi:hypothetical protein